MIGNILKLLLLYEISVSVLTTVERHNYYNKSREYCNLVSKPLLRIGMKRGPLEPPNGDVTIDIDPAVLDIPGGMIGDERNMPFTDKQFGVTFNEHTLEHLYTVNDVKMAVNECIRVADKAVFLVPSPYSLIGNCFNPTHHLRIWLDQTNNKIMVSDNRFRTGAGFNYGTEHDYVNNPSNIGQALVTSSVPQVVTTGTVFFVI